MINTGPSRECTHFIRSRKQGEFRKLYPLVRLGKVLSKEMTVRSVGFGMGPTVRVDFGESDKYRMCDGIGPKNRHSKNHAPLMNISNPARTKHLTGASVVICWLRWVDVDINHYE
ncbi:hypothetical protein TMatcc_002762 [Talaromyces marneffei ATCC 18224]